MAWHFINTIFNALYHPIYIIESNKVSFFALKKLIISIFYKYMVGSKNGRRNADQNLKLKLEALININI